MQKFQHNVFGRKYATIHMNKPEEKEMPRMKLYAPMEARTPDTVMIYWDKFREGPCTVDYQVYVNDRLFSCVACTDETITGLDADTEYTLQVAAAENGSILEKTDPLIVRTAPLSGVMDISAFGAAGDGKSLNTRPIQLAIDACPPGGTVYVPDGVYVTGALFLKSDMTLRLSNHATLLGSGDIRDYPVFSYRYEGREAPRFASLINMPIEVPGACKTKPAWKNVTIRGGVINANGMALIQQELDSPHGHRGSAVCLRNVDGLYLYDVTVRQAPFWCLHVIYSNHVTMNRVRIRNKFDEQGNRYQALYNGDGIDPDSCSDVAIVHSSIESQDDCIAVKSGRDEEGRAVAVPSVRIRITNCEFSHGFGAAVGSEMSGGVSDVLVQDCTFRQSFSLASVKNCRGRGSVIERVLYENIRMVNTSAEHDMTKWFKGAIYVDQFYGVDGVSMKESEPVSDGTPAIRDIVFRNITLDTVRGYGIYLRGLPENHLRNIQLENVAGSAPYTIYTKHADEITMENVHISETERKNE